MDADRIRSVIEDEEIDLSVSVAMRGADTLNPEDLGPIIVDVLTKLRSLQCGTSEREQRAYEYWRSRYLFAVRHLREAIGRIRDRARAARPAILAAEARRTGRETCECGGRHVRGAAYYVTARYRGRYVPLAGPYPTHAESLAALPKVQERVYALDIRAHDYAYGTAMFAPSKAPLPILGV